MSLNKQGKFNANTNWFKPSAAGEQIKIYSKPDINSTTIAELTYGDEIELGAVKSMDGEEWITVTMPDGHWGYMPGKSKIILCKQLSLFEKEAIVYSEPSTQSTVISHMKKNTPYHTIPYGSHDERWVKIRDADGNEGFISSQTRGKLI